MTTVINNPGDGSNDSSGSSGVIVGAVLVVLVLVVVLIFALPYIRQQIDAMSHPGKPTINVQLPDIPKPNPSGGSGSSTPQ